MKVTIKVTQEVEPKVLKVHMKVCDGFSASLTDDKGQVLKDYDGYVPGFMPGIHNGDYVILDIDIDTGQILNWTKPTVEQLEEFISDGER